METENSVDARIESHREQIDDIDSRIIDLLEQRAAISRRIQERRMEGGGTRTVFSREMEVLERYRAGLGRPGTTIAMKVLELCRGTAPGSSAATASATSAPVSTGTNAR